MFLEKANVTFQTSLPNYGKLIFTQLKVNFEKFPFPIELQLCCSAPHRSRPQDRSCFDIHKALQAKTQPEPSSGPSSSASGTKFGRMLDYMEEDCHLSWPQSNPAAGSCEGPEPITLAKVLISNHEDKSYFIWDKTCFK